MFDNGRYSPRRRLDPAVEVLVDLSRLWPPSRMRWGTDTPLWVRNHGIKVDTVVPGTVTEWVLTSVGDWYGLCTFAVRVGGSWLELTQLVPREALRKKSEQPARRSRAL